MQHSAHGDGATEIQFPLAGLPAARPGGQPMPQGTDAYTSKTKAAWTILSDRYAGRLTSAELDHLFACFVLGLTTPAFGEAEPARHFEVVRKLVALQVPPERTQAALHEIPESSAPWVEGAYASVERQGVNIGLALAAGGEADATGEHR
ncbi:hypothetical protein [Mesorhizobium retamae]|uniref:Uncharacterized protein n=1 Tax=Mesorhizobium retamae TaxID=2912854 RepID=A0ABS9QL91_9HYPH|nr:hypothetical protein [Mesorhizobium sp. IRAMC:0171]MCG7508223.1 hypothetical protein [Mesorhizobium sp. IRAMC:0171]